METIIRNNKYLQNFTAQFKTKERNHLIEPLLVIAANLISSEYQSSANLFDEIIKKSNQIQGLKKDDSSALRKEIFGLKEEIQKLNAKFERKLQQEEIQAKKISDDPKQHQQKPQVQIEVSSLQKMRVKRSTSLTGVGGKNIQMRNLESSPNSRKQEVTLKVTEVVPNIPKPVKYTPKLHHLNDDQIKGVIGGFSEKENRYNDSNQAISAPSKDLNRNRSSNFECSNNGTNQHQRTESSQKTKKMYDRNPKVTELPLTQPRPQNFKQNGGHATTTNKSYSSNQNTQGVNNASYWSQASEHKGSEFNFHVQSTGQTLRGQLSPKFNSELHAHHSPQSSIHQNYLQKGDQYPTTQSFNNHRNQNENNVKRTNTGYQSNQQGEMDKREILRRVDSLDGNRQRSTSQKTKKIYYDPRKMQRGELFGKQTNPQENNWRNVPSKIRERGISNEFMINALNRANEGPQAEENSFFEDRPRQISYNLPNPMLPAPTSSSQAHQQFQEQRYSRGFNGTQGAAAKHLNHMNNSQFQQNSGNNSHLFSLNGQQGEYFNDNNNDQEYSAYLNNGEDQHRHHQYSDDMVNGVHSSQQLSQNHSQSPFRDVHQPLQQQQYQEQGSASYNPDDLENSQQSRFGGGIGNTYQSSDSMNMRQSFNTTQNNGTMNNNNTNINQSGYAPQVQESFTDYYGGANEQGEQLQHSNYHSDFSHSADIDNQPYLRVYSQQQQQQQQMYQNNNSGKYMRKPSSSKNSRSQQQQYEFHQNNSNNNISNSYYQNASQQDNSIVNNSNSNINPFTSYAGATGNQQYAVYGLDRLSYQSNYVEKQSPENTQYLNNHNNRGTHLGQQNVYERRYNEITSNSKNKSGQNRTRTSNSVQREANGAVAPVQSGRSGMNSTNRSKMTSELSPYQDDSTNKKHFHTISPERQSSQNFDQRSQQQQQFMMNQENPDMKGLGAEKSLQSLGTNQKSTQQSTRNTGDQSRNAKNSRLPTSASSVSNQKFGNGINNNQYHAQSSGNTYPTSMQHETFTNRQEIACEYSDTSNGLNSPQQRPENQIEGSIDGEFSPLDIPEENKRVFQDDKMFFKKSHQSQSMSRPLTLRSED